MADLAALTAAVVAGNPGADPPARVVIGGAPTTPELAAQMGSDDQAPDAGVAVDLARRLLAS
jgi:methanogenic corrinoid protein MtbC1